MKNRYLIVGVNGAGFYALERLRALEPNSEITAVNGENYLPYKRTKINKSFFPDKLDVGHFLLAGADWYNANNIKLINGQIVKNIDIHKNEAILDNGDLLFWDKLLLAVGAESFQPEGAAFNNAFSFRSYDDALKLKTRIRAGGKALVYGLGIESLETVCQLKSSGIDVILAGRGNSLLDRFFSRVVMEDIKKILENKGVSVIYGIDPADVSLIKYDFMVYSTGISPRTELAKVAGIDTARGIIVDNRRETSAADIYAAGDCAEVETGIITDHWHAAQDQGRTAAENMAGGSAFWPVKKYRLKTELFDNFFFSMRPFRYEPPSDLNYEDSTLSVGVFRRFYYKENRLVGLEMVNDKDRARLYEEAVNKGWTREEVLTGLS